MKDYYVVCKLFFSVYDVIQADDLTSEEADNLVNELSESDSDEYTWFEKHNKKENSEKYLELLTHDANKKYIK